MHEFEECYVCKKKVCHSTPSDGSFLFCDCKKCGKFLITPEARFDYDLDQYNNARAILSYWIRNHQGNKPVQITSAVLNSILENTSLPKPKEQADNFIKLIGDSVSSPEEDLNMTYNLIASYIGATSIWNVEYIIKHLMEQKLIVTYLDTEKKFQGHLTFYGWERFDEIMHETKDSKTVFMAMKFGEVETDTLYKEVLIEAVKDTGFELRKLDDYPKAGLIDDRLRVEIRRAKFLIVDLTHDNPGAYFESGFAEGLGKKVIYICEKEKFEKHKTHFDTNHHLTLKWDSSNPKEFTDQLKATIRATFPDEAIMED